MCTDFAKKHSMAAKKTKSTFIFAAVITMLLAANGVFAQDARALRADNQGIQTGIASYYSNSFNGQTTSSGETFSNSKLTAASNSLPLGTYVKVTNVHNHKWVVVKINDRMNKYNKRAIDLTRFAAKKLGMLYRGIVRVKVQVIPPEFYAFYHITPDELVVFGSREANANGS